MVNPYDPSGISKAKDHLKNTIIGIVVALAAWMIVDAVMAVLYHPNDSSWGAWSSLITSGGIEPCLKQAGALSTDTLNQAKITGISANGGVIATSGKSVAQCSSSNSACSPAFLQSVGFLPAQANVMSCIAVTENSGNATGCNGNACGTFQIMLTANPLVGPACGGTLNCPVLCKGANGVAVQNEPSCQPCVQAANNFLCNAQTAKYLFSKSSYTPWTVGNANSAACIQQYGNG